MQRKLHLISYMSLSYILTICVVGLAFWHLNTPARTPSVAAQQPHSVTRASTPHKAAIAGIPTHLRITAYGIDLPIDQGTHNPADGSWTLSDTNAQFAVVSNPANDKNGNTFVYGHGTDAVFGKLGSGPLIAGTTAEIHTDNGYIFKYLFRASQDHTPNDTSIFNDVVSGPPRLTVQTCTGAWSQWRTMFTFDFQEVKRA